MNVTGPLQVTPQPTTPGFELSLKVNQRVSGEILQVSGTQAVISVEGIPVVARLASAQQGLDLSVQKRAHFIVTEVSGQSVTLKLVGPGQSEAPLVGQVIPERDLATRLLDQIGLPINAETLTLTRAAISQHLVVTPELLQELQAALSGLENWNNSQAELAAALKAAGMPLSAASSQVALESMTPLSTAITHLADQLQTALMADNTPADVKALITNALGLLEAASPDWSGLPAQLEQQLKQTVTTFGRSFENGVLKADANSGQDSSINPLLSFVHLQTDLAQAGQKDLSDAVAHFINQAHAAQFLNVHPDPTPGSGAWTQLSFMLHAPGAQGQKATYPARLRIARRPSPRKAGIDPGYTHLSVQVEVEPSQYVQVDLSLAGKQLRAVVTAPDPVWGQEARTEMPGLEQALDDLGYSVHDTQVNIGAVRNADGLLIRQGSGSESLSVDVEI